MSREDLIAKANKPMADALRLHPFYKGKVQVLPKCAVRGFDDFAVWYTPGVAAPCRAIQAEPALVYEHTNKGNTIAIVTDGTRVLGLGDIGPEAGLPVMEGKALLFKFLGGVDAIPICLGSKDPEAKQCARLPRRLSWCAGHPCAHHQRRRGAGRRPRAGRVRRGREVARGPDPSVHGRVAGLSAGRGRHSHGRSKGRRGQLAKASQQLHREATALIGTAREATRVLLDQGLILAYG
jgi:malic enzyme-like protein